MAKIKDGNGKKIGQPKSTAIATLPKAAAVSAPSTAAQQPADTSAALPKGFSLDDPEFPKALDDAAMRSGGYPYDKRMKREDFDEQLQLLQVELVKLQMHNIKARERVLILHEGRDGAGKGSCIKSFAEHDDFFSSYGRQQNRSYDFSIGGRELCGTSSGELSM